MNKEIQKINEAVKVVVDSITSIDIKGGDIKRVFSEQPNFSGSFVFGKDNRVGHFNLKTTSFGWSANHEPPTDVKWNIMRDTDVELSGYSIDVSIESEDKNEDDESIIYRHGSLNYNGGNVDADSEAVAMFMEAITPDVREAVKAERKHQLFHAKMNRNRLLEKLNVKGIIQKYVDTIVIESGLDNDDNPYLTTFKPVINLDDEVLYEYDENDWINHEDMIPGNIVQTSDDYDTNIVGLNIDEILKLWVKDGLGNPLTGNLKLEFHHGSKRGGYTAGLDIEQVNDGDFGYWCSPIEKSANKKGFMLTYSKTAKNGAWTTQSATNPNTALKTMVDDIETSFSQLLGNISEAKKTYLKDTRNERLEDKIESVLDDLGVQMPAMSKKSPYKWESEDMRNASNLGRDDYGRIRNAGFRCFSTSKLNMAVDVDIYLKSQEDSDQVWVSIQGKEYDLEVDSEDISKAVEAILDRIQVVKDIEQESYDKIEALGDITI